MVIKSVKVYNGESANGSYTGPRTFTVVSSTMDTIAQTTVDVTEGEQRLNLNLAVPAGTGYRLLPDRHVGLWRDFGGATFPYYLGDLCEITADVRYDGLEANPPDAYHFFYDWEIDAVSDSSSCRSSVKAVIIPEAMADFGYNAYDTTVFFINGSKGDNFIWYADNQRFSTETNPVHVFPGYGAYTVKLVAENNCGADSIEKVIVLEEIHFSVAESKEYAPVSCFPNPASTTVYIDAEKQLNAKCTITLFNSSGNTVMRTNTNSLNNFPVNISHLSDGVYFIAIAENNKLIYKPLRFVVVK